jgi:nicotinic acid mononucleotide adenylyltransferase
MLLLAIARNPRFSAALSSHGLFLDIHRAVAAHYPAGTRTYFLTGRDAAERILLRWPYRNPQKALAEMFARFELGVAGRGGRFEVPPGSPAAKYAQKIHPLETPAGTEEASATLVRERIARRQPVETLVPKGVALYIAAHHLYHP